MDTSRAPQTGGRSPYDVPVANAYRAWAAALTRYATSQIRDPAAAEDVVQDAFAISGLPDQPSPGRRGPHLRRELLRPAGLVASTR